MFKREREKDYVAMKTKTSQAISGKKCPLLNKIKSRVNRKKSEIEKLH